MQDLQIQASYFAGPQKLAGKISKELIILWTDLTNEYNKRRTELSESAYRSSLKVRYISLN